MLKFIPPSKKTADLLIYAETVSNSQKAPILVLAVVIVEIGVMKVVFNEVVSVVGYS